MTIQDINGKVDNGKKIVSFDAQRYLADQQALLIWEQVQQQANEAHTNWASTQ
jgi:hypothetical protein